ncbi:MAG: efflux RND transporter permease subunit, partial [Chryseolinea sp.]
PEYSFDVRSPYEYHLDIDRDKLSAIEASQVEVFHAMNEQNAYKVISDLHFNGSQEVFLSSQENLDTWKIVNQPFTIGDRSHKMNGVLSLTKAQAVSDIYKMNQQYQLVVAYNFMGEAAQSEKFQRNIIAGLREKVPVGFRIVSPFDLSSNSNEFNQYYLLVMLIIGIYFICAAFFESFILPLAVCVIIPVAYIGVFLSFYLFEVNYDDGGFATFILITCVASHLAMIVCADVIYTHSSQSVLLRFQKAVMSSASRLPIILVVTIALLFSFVHGGKNVVFWYTICVGTISGVFFSLLGILIVLPMILPERIRSWRMK